MLLAFEVRVGKAEGDVIELGAIEEMREESHGTSEDRGDAVVVTSG